MSHPARTRDVGRDPNGATWRVVRGSHAWSTATLVDAIYDRYRDVVELAPVATLEEPTDGEETPAEEALREREAASVPVETVLACDGFTAYRSDPPGDRVLVRRPGEVEFVPMPGCGGRGSATGQLRRPLGLAVDARDWLYVADSDNHRVQVVRPDDGSVVVVLGARDGWGQPVAGETGGAMRQPVDVAVDPRTCEVFVLDREAALVHVFDGGFAYRHSFAPRRTSSTTTAGPPMDLVAIALDDDGRVLVFDRAWARLLVAERDGTPAAERSLGATAHPRMLGLGTRARFALQGELIVGPLDGLHRLQTWHRVFVDCACPPGTRVEVQTFAADETTTAAIWAPADPVPLTGSDDRLVLGPADRGRYLWVRLALFGDGRSSPTVAALRVVFPRRAYLDLLPAVYARREVGDPQGSLFIERFLALFEGRMTDLELAYEGFTRQLDVDAASPEWLPWLASWFCLLFDPSWTTAKRRAVLREIVELYRRRGTPAGLSRFIELYTGRAPVLVEGFRLHPGTASATATTCGWLLADGSDAGPPEDRFAHRFTVYVYLDDEADEAAMRSGVRALVDIHKPAHTLAQLRFILPSAAVGLQSTVGVDVMIGPGAPGGLVLDAPDRGILGTSRLHDGRPRAAFTPLTHTDVTPRIDDSFRLL